MQRSVPDEPYDHLNDTATTLRAGEFFRNDGSTKVKLGSAMSITLAWAFPSPVSLVTDSVNPRTMKALNNRNRSTM